MRDRKPPSVIAFLLRHRPLTLVSRTELAYQFYLNRNETVASAHQQP